MRSLDSLCCGANAGHSDQRSCLSNFHVHVHHHCYHYNDNRCYVSSDYRPNHANHNNHAHDYDHDHPTAIPNVGVSVASGHHNVERYVQLAAQLYGQ